MVHKTAVGEVLNVQQQQQILQQGEQHSLVELGRRLLASARDGDADEVRALIQKGAPFTTDWLGTSPLHLAAQFGHRTTCLKLLAAGISKDARTKVDKTALHVAAQEGQVEVMELLLQYGCEVDAQDMLLMTPLHWAVERGEVGAVETLLKFGADVAIESKFSKSPMEIASDQDRTDIFTMLQNPEQYRQKLPRQQYKTDAATLAATNSITIDDTNADAEAAPIAGSSSSSGQQQQQQQQQPSSSKQDTIKFLENQGIKMLPAETYGQSPLEKTVRQNSYVLTEAGKAALSSGATSGGQRIIKRYITTTRPQVTAAAAATSSSSPSITILPAVSTATPTTTPGAANRIVKLGSTTPTVRLASNATRVVTAAAAAGGTTIKPGARVIRVNQQQLKQIKEANLSATGSRMKIIRLPTNARTGGGANQPQIISLATSTAAASTAAVLTSVATASPTVTTASTSTPSLIDPAIKKQLIDELKNDPEIKKQIMDEVKAELKQKMLADLKKQSSSNNAERDDDDNDGMDHDGSG